MGDRHDDQERARSAEACPACGQHELALLDFPTVQAIGYQPYLDIIGMGEPEARVEPAIGCLACGSEWPTLAAFRRASAEDAPS